jgi:Protein of unknown function (DUF3460)
MANPPCSGKLRGLGQPTQFFRLSSPTFQGHRMAIYKSEITHFLEQLKKERPHLDKAQSEGRALLWDKDPISPERASELEAAKVSQKAYPYQTK